MLPKLSQLPQLPKLPPLDGSHQLPLSAWTLMGHEYVELKNTAAAVDAYRHAVEPRGGAQEGGDRRTLKRLLE